MSEEEERPALDSPTELARVFAWRLLFFLELGIDVETAERWAPERTPDCHFVEHLIRDLGCSAELATRIAG